MTDHLTRFEQELVREGKRPLTIKSYLRDLRQFATWFRQTNGEEATPQGITILDARSYKSYLMTVRGYKPATVNRRLASPSRFCRWAKAEGLIESDPTENVKGVSQVKPAPKALDRLELRRVMREVQKSGKVRDIAIMEVLANTGIRVGELTRLALADIEMSPRKGMLTVRSGKGAKYRRVPLNADARRALEVYLETRPKGTESDLFLGQRGGGLTSSAVWRVVKKYGERAGVELSPHTLRHTFGTRLVRSGEVDLVTVSAMMGHESLDTTAIYTHPTEDDMAEAAETLAEG
jgi:site-specific recombinase XerD